MKNSEKMKAAWGSIFVPGGRNGVLLVHSLGGSPIELKFVAHTLAQAGLHRLLPPAARPRRRHRRLRPVELAGLVRGARGGARRAHPAVRQRHRRRHLGRNMLALRLAALRPEKVHGLMLFSPTFWPNGWAIPWYFSLFQLVQQKWAARLFQLPRAHAARHQGRAAAQLHSRQRADRDGLPSRICSRAAAVWCSSSAGSCAT